MENYEELIKERIEYDDDSLNDACERMSKAVTRHGAKSHFNFDSKGSGTKDAIGILLSYYNVKDVVIPAKLETLDEMLEYVLQPRGIMRRRVRLTDDWYKNAYGPFLGTLKSSGDTIAIMPGKLGGYKYYDEKSDSFIRVNKRTAADIDEDAYSFYWSFPLRQMRIMDLVMFIKRLVTVSDIVSVLAIYGVVTLLGLLTPKFTNFLYGRIVDVGSVSLLLGFTSMMIAVSISQLLVSAIQKLVMDRLNTRISMCVSAATMSRLFSLPVTFFRDYTAGELSSITGYVSTLCNTLINTVMSTSLSTLFSLVYVTQIFAYAPSLVAPAIIIVAASTVFSIILTLVSIKRSERLMKSSTKLSGLEYSLVTGVSKIKLAGAEKRAFAKWAKEYADNVALSYNPRLIIKYGGIISTVITSVGTIVMYFCAVQSGITISEYMAFNVAYGYMSGAFGALTGIVSQLSNIKPVIKMTRPILNAVPENAENKEILTEFNGNVSIDHVSFRYSNDTPYVLENLSLKIDEGQYVAIVGKTGCGKSTLVRLLLGFETPQLGAIYMDGKNLNNIDLKSLRRRIGTVLQNGGTFHGEIFSNIVISAPSATLDDAWEAAELAGIDEDIKNMPMGMNTIISEGQGGISGGQKQRLLIARAVVGKPNMLIFDEATSALDNITQKKISEALDGLNCTRIVIAHRLSTIRNCDRIVVLDKGKIIEDGTYDELIANNGFFKELVAKQQLDIDGAKEE